MSKMTTIQIKNETAEQLKTNKAHVRESYDDIIQKLLKFYEHSKTCNQDDEFLHKIHQMKIQELWDNDEDDAWEQAERE